MNFDEFMTPTYAHLLEKQGYRDDAAHVKSRLSRSLSTIAILSPAEELTQRKIRVLRTILDRIDTKRDLQLLSDGR